MHENEKYALILVSNGNLACLGVGSSEDMDAILSTLNNINEWCGVKKICVPNTVNIDVDTSSDKLAEAVGSLVFA